MSFPRNWRLSLSSCLLLPGLPSGDTAFAADGTAKSAATQPASVRQRPGRAAIASAIDGKGAQQISAHKRFHHQYLSDEAMVEQGTFDRVTSDALTKMGYTLKQRESWGFMNVVTWDGKTNKLDAAGDPHRPSGLGLVQ